MKTIYICIAALAATCSAVAQQATPQATQPQSLSYILGVHQNTKQLRVELKLDREVYFPGEMAELTVTITNPTSRALLVEEPLSVGSGDIGLVVQRADHFEAVAQKTRDGFIIVGTGATEPTVHTVLMQPGEQRQRTIRTDDAMFDDDEIMDLTIDGFLPLEAGHYVFGYGYGSGASVAFDIVQPVVLRAVQPSSSQAPATGSPSEPSAKPWGGPLGELEWDGKRYLVASLRPASLRRSPNGPLAPFVRLDTLEGQMPTVEYIDGADGSITFIWEGADGIRKRLPFRQRKLTVLERRESEEERAK